MKRGRVNQICYGILAVLAIALFHIDAILLTAYLCFFRADFLNRECEKHQVLSQLGINRNELHQVTEEMISYVKGYGNSLDVTVTINGNTMQFFNERDKQHLADIAVSTGSVSGQRNDTGGLDVRASSGDCGGNLEGSHTKTQRLRRNRRWRNRTWDSHI